MISYAKSFSDDRSCVYSLDNLVFDYLCKISNMDIVLDALGSIFQKHVEGWTAEKYSRKGQAACSAYSWFACSVWGDGIYIQFGQYRDYDAVEKSWHILPVIRIKINPNKHYTQPLFLDILSWLSENADNGALIKFDFAVDVPTQIDNVAVKSRKEPGLYKGTRYFGQRGKPGRLKIYDKGKESKLPYQLTRVEYTFTHGRSISFDDVSWLTTGPVPLPDVSELGKVAYLYSRMLLEIRNAGGDWRSCYEMLDIRTKQKIEPYVNGTGIQLYLPVAYSFLRQLLEAYCLDLSLSFVSDGVNKIEIGKSNLVPVISDDDETADLPF